MTDHLQLIDDGTLDTVVRCDLCGDVVRLAPGVIERDWSGDITDFGWAQITTLHEEDCGQEHEKPIRAMRYLLECMETGNDLTQALDLFRRTGWDWENDEDYVRANYPSHWEHGLGILYHFILDLQNR